MNTQKSLINLTNFVHELAFESYQNWVLALKDTFQKALAISFRHAESSILKKRILRCF